MTINQATTYFEGLVLKSNNASETKIYNKFIQLLSGLKNRPFTKTETQWIETELNELNLDSNPKNKKKFFKKSLAQFERFLIDRFSLCTKGYYTQLGTALGSSFGVLFGVVVLSSFERSQGIAFGLLIGMLLGLAIGRSKDKKAIEEGRVLNV